MIARAVSLYGTGVSAGSSLNTDPLNGLKIVIVDHLPLSAAFIASCTGKTLTSPGGVLQAFSTAAFGVGPRKHLCYYSTIVIITFDLMIFDSSFL